MEFIERTPKITAEIYVAIMGLVLLLNKSFKDIVRDHSLDLVAVLIHRGWSPEKAQQIVLVQCEVELMFNTKH